MVTKITRMNSSPIIAATCGRKISNGFDIFTMPGSPAFGYPAPAIAVVIPGLEVLASVYGTSLPLTTTFTPEPAGAFTVEYLTDDWARKARAVSHGAVNTRVPTGLNRSPHPAGSATTSTLTVSMAFSSAGFALVVIILKIGKKVSAAIRQPARMIGLRPILSDSAPNTTKKPVPSNSDHAISKFAVNGST